VPGGLKLASGYLVVSLCAANLAGQSKLTVSTATLHQYEDGPVLAPSYEFLPGETV